MAQEALSALGSSRSLGFSHHGSSMFLSHPWASLISVLVLAQVLLPRLFLSTSLASDTSLPSHLSGVNLQAVPGGSPRSLPMAWVVFIFHLLAQQPWLSYQNISLAHLSFACLLHKRGDDVRLVKGLNGGRGHSLNSRATCLMSMLWK